MKSKGQKLILFMEIPFVINSCSLTPYRVTTDFSVTLEKKAKILKSQNLVFSCFDFQFN